MNHLNNGTKNAATIVNEFWKKHQHLMNDEESMSMKILIAAAMQQDDWQPSTWHCDIYCRKVRHVSCEGDMCAIDSSPAACPYLDEMLY